MDLNDSFSTFYPSYFNNQSASVNPWSPNLRDHEPKMGTSSNEKYKSEDDFDYHILVESLFNTTNNSGNTGNSGTIIKNMSNMNVNDTKLTNNIGTINGNVTNMMNMNGNTVSNNVANMGVGMSTVGTNMGVTAKLSNVSDRLAANVIANSNVGVNANLALNVNNFESVMEGPRQSGSPLTFKNINWSDFENNYMTKSLTRQLAKTKLTASQTDLLSQLQSDWQSKPNVNTKTVNNQMTNNNNLGLSMTNGINSMFSRILEDGFETRLNSSRDSDKSTNRTNLTGNMQSLNNSMGNALVSGLTYSGMTTTNMLNSQLINNNLGTIGTVNPNLVNVNNLGNNANAQLLRNQLLNNQLLNRQLLNNQILNSQFLANQNMFNGANINNTFRSMGYNGDYMGGQFVGTNDYVSSDFIGNNDYLQSNFNVDANGIPMNFYDYHAYNYGKFCKPLIKSQFSFKSFKNRPLRKKRSKSDLFPLPSLKDADFDKAMEYLRQTLISLYRDQIMPIYFNVRGRFIEFNADEIAPEHIMDICKRKPEVFNVVSNGALNETFIYLVDEPEWFTEWVDRNDLTDVYKIEMWEQFFDFIKNYRDDDGNEYFPGSIYGMSRVMQKLKLPFLDGMSLGTICHIVQLAIRLKRYLVYDLKTLKPSEAVRNNQFHELTQSAQNDSSKPLNNNEDATGLDVDKNAVSGEKTELKA